MPTPPTAKAPQVQGAVAVSDDGSHVYFAALGQLVPGKGRTYAQNVAGEGSANVYLAHEGGVSYVTTLERGNGDALRGRLDAQANVLDRRSERRRRNVLVFESTSDPDRSTTPAAARRPTSTRPTRTASTASPAGPTGTRR